MLNDDLLHWWTRVEDLVRAGPSWLCCAQYHQCPVPEVDVEDEINHVEGRPSFPGWELCCRVLRAQQRAPASSMRASGRLEIGMADGLVYALCVHPA